MDMGGGSICSFVAGCGSDFPFAVYKRSGKDYRRPVHKSTVSCTHSPSNIDACVFLSMANVYVGLNDLSFVLVIPTHRHLSFHSDIALNAAMLCILGTELLLEMIPK